MGSGLRHRGGVHSGCPAPALPGSCRAPAPPGALVRSFAGRDEGDHRRGRLPVLPPPPAGGDGQGHPGPGVSGGRSPAVGAGTERRAGAERLQPVAEHRRAHPDPAGDHVHRGGRGRRRGAGAAAGGKPPHRQLQGLPAPVRGAGRGNERGCGFLRLRLLHLRPAPLRQHSSDRAAGDP